MTCDAERDDQRVGAVGQAERGRRLGEEPAPTSPARRVEAVDQEAVDVDPVERLLARVPDRPLAGPVARRHDAYRLAIIPPLSRRDFAELRHKSPAQIAPRQCRPQCAANREADRPAGRSRAVMTSRIIAVEPFDLVVFGGAGDLAYRKLLPALYHRHRDGQIPPAARIIGVSRAADERRRSTARRPARRSPSTSPEAELRAGGASRRFLKRLHFVPVDAQSGRRLGRPRRRCSRTARTASAPSISPSAPELFGTISRQARRARAGHAEDPRDHREADRPRPRTRRARSTTRSAQVFDGAADLPHRPLSRQGDGAEPDGAPLRQCAVRAAVERRPHRPRADHGRRDASASRAAAATTTRPARSATWCRTT